MSFIAGALLVAAVIGIVIVAMARPSAGRRTLPPDTAAPADLTPVLNRTPTPKPDIDPEKFEESRNRLFRLISEVGVSIQQLVGAAAHYDAGLAAHEARLQQETDAADLAKTCQELLAELHEMRAANAKYEGQLAETQEKLREREAEVASLQLDMNSDFLTRILNRRGLEARIQEEMARAKRYDTPFSVAMFDIDHFKVVNDEHGHAAGDKVIRLVAHTLEELKRTNDSAGRYGGEEFMLLLPSAASEHALGVADRARRQMERFVTRFNDSRIRVTLSGGVAQYRPDEDTLETLMRRVDAALYAAKEKGRNCIEVANGGAG